MQAAQSNAILSPVDVTLIRHRRQSEVLPPLGISVAGQRTWKALPKHPL